MRRQYRNFDCQNRRCAKPFSEFVEAIDGTIQQGGREVPVHMIRCPYCNARGARIRVVKVHSNLSKTGNARATDQSLNAIAQRYGMTDISNSGGAAAKPLQFERQQKSAPPSQLPAGDSVQYTPAPGFSVPFTGNPHAGWSTSSPGAKVNVSAGKSVSRGSVPPTKVAAQHNG